MNELSVIVEYALPLFELMIQIGILLFAYKFFKKVYSVLYKKVTIKYNLENMVKKETQNNVEESNNNFITTLLLYCFFKNK